MIQLIPCSKCEQTFVLQPGVSEKATLACPNCEQEIVLKNLLESQYGYWKVLSDPDAELKLASDQPSFKEVSRPTNPAVASAIAASNSLQEAVEDGEELRISAPVERPKIKQPFTHVEPITYEQFERMKRKDRSPIWSVIQILLGGLAAVPIALILIWHLLGKDIGGAGPAVAKYAPWIVPEKFHPEADGEQEESENENTDDGFPESPETGTAGGFRQFSEEELSGVPGEEDWERAGYSGDEGSGSRTGEEDDGGYPGEEAAADDGSGTKAGGIPGKERDVNLGSAVGGNKPSGPDATNPPVPANEKAKERTTEEPDASSNPEEPNAAASENASSSETNSVGSNRGSKAGSPANVFVKIARCQDSLEEWRNGGDTEVDSRQKLGDSIFAQLAGLTDELAKLPPGSPFFKAIRDKMQPIGKAVKQDQDLHEVLLQQASYRSQQREQDGTFSLAVVVEIESVEEGDDFWNVIPNTEDMELSLGTVKVPRSLAPALNAGQRLLLLGRLEDPSSAPEGEV